MATRPAGMAVAGPPSLLWWRARQLVGRPPPRELRGARRRGPPRLWWRRLVPVPMRGTTTGPSSSSRVPFLRSRWRRRRRPGSPARCPADGSGAQVARSASWVTGFGSQPAGSGRCPAAGAVVADGSSGGVVAAVRLVQALGVAFSLCCPSLYWPWLLLRRRRVKTEAAVSAGADVFRNVASGSGGPRARAMPTMVGHAPRVCC